MLSKLNEIGEPSDKNIVKLIKITKIGMQIGIKSVSKDFVDRVFFNIGSCNLLILPLPYAVENIPLHIFDRSCPILLFLLRLT